MLQSAAPKSDTVTAFLVGASDVEIWGMTGSERAERILHRAGVDDIAIGGTEIESGRSALFLRTDFVIDEALVEALTKRPSTLLAVDTEDGLAPVAAHVVREQVGSVGAIVRKETVDRQALADLGVDVVSPTELIGTYNRALRKKANPLVLPLRPDSIRQIERATFGAAYKGVTDFVTKWIWPPIALPITRALARRGVRPNAVTAVSLVCVLAAMAMFATGHYLAGVAFGWAMALLDTVDGKLARVTLTSSWWGNVFDHGIDLVAPPLWWLFWWYGLDAREEPLLFFAMTIVVGGYIAGKIVEKTFIARFGIKTHVWRRLDSTFRQITARRNPNLALLTIGAIAGQPAGAYVALAAWTVICLSFHLVRLGQAFAASRNGSVIRSWMEAEA